MTGFHYLAWQKSAGSSSPNLLPHPPGHTVGLQLPASLWERWPWTGLWTVGSDQTPCVPVPARSTSTFHTCSPTFFSFLETCVQPSGAVRWGRQPWLNLPGTFELLESRVTRDEMRGDRWASGGGQGRETIADCTTSCPIISSLALFQTEDALSTVRTHSKQATLGVSQFSLSWVVL